MALVPPNVPVGWFLRRSASMPLDQRRAARRRGLQGNQTERTQL